MVPDAKAAFIRCNQCRKEEGVYLNNVFAITMDGFNKCRPGIFNEDLMPTDLLTATY